jgi:hypothetical protein
MKSLLTVLLLFSLSASAQTVGDCITCTKPYGVQVVVSGGDLGVGWDNSWKWTSSGECTKGVSILINGVEYFATADSLLHGSSASSVVFPGLGTGSVCVVVRNYCSNPFKGNPTNYVDSDPACITVPVAATSSLIPCKDGNKWVITKNGTTTKVNQLRCQTMVTQGWTSSCNCQ